jgi:hypothetical protein
LSCGCFRGLGCCFCFASPLALSLASLACSLTGGTDSVCCCVIVCSSRKLMAAVSSFVPLGVSPAAGNPTRLYI